MKYSVVYLGIDDRADMGVASFDNYEEASYFADCCVEMSKKPNHHAQVAVTVYRIGSGEPLTVWSYERNKNHP